MIVSAHQPHFFPWIGYLNKIHLSDIFMIMDNMYFTNEGYIARNRIVGTKGIQYINVPVRKLHGLNIKISELEIEKRTRANWNTKLLRKLKHNYYQGEGFDCFFPLIEDVLLSNWDTYFELSYQIITVILAYLKIDVTVMKASRKNTKGAKENELIFNILKDSSCDSILLGLGASVNYVDINLLKTNGYNVYGQELSHPIYPQKSKNFIPGLSSLDLLLNVKQQAAIDIVKNCGRIKTL